MNKNLKEIVKPITALSVTCLVVASLLAVTNFFTAPVIAQAGNARELAALSLVLPQGEGFKPLKAAFTENTSTVYKAENGAGYAISAMATGYHGEIEVMFGIDKSGKIIGVEVLEQSETKGLGDKITTEEYRRQYYGKVGKLVTVNRTAENENEVSAIAGATTSSKAMTDAANAALAAYEKVREL